MRSQLLSTTTFALSVGGLGAVVFLVWWNASAYGYLIGKAPDADEERPKGPASVRFVGSVPELQQAGHDSPRWYHPSSQELRATYAKMSQAFASNGFNADAILANREYFAGLGPPSVTFQSAWPKLYTDLERPLPESAVRILVVPVMSSPAMGVAGSAITAEVAAALPAGVITFPNRRSNYHITVFHTSQPTDPRPEAILPDGGADLSRQPHERPGPSKGQLDEELRVMTELIGSMQPPILHFERIVFTETGTLLMTWTDDSGNLELLRRRLRETFPGASTKQAWIIHTSLSRVLSPVTLDQEDRERIQAVCDKWTEKLAGSTWSPTHLWFIYEKEFSTIEGDRHVLPLAGTE